MAIRLEVYKVVTYLGYSVVRSMMCALQTFLLLLPPTLHTMAAREEVFLSSNLLSSPLQVKPGHEYVKEYHLHVYWAQNNPQQVGERGIWSVVGGGEEEGGQGDGEWEGGGEGGGEREKKREEKRKEEKEQ